MGSTCDTVVMTVWRLTRSPTCAFATPAIPAIGEVTFVHLMLRFVRSSAARADARFACAVRSRVWASSSSCWLIAFSLTSGVYRATVVFALASAASYWDTLPLAWSYEA